MIFKRQPSSSKDEDNKKDKTKGICYECEKLGHYRLDCLSLANKKGKSQQNNFMKSRKTYVAWDRDSIVSSKEISSDSDEETNYCLMANQCQSNKKNVSPSK